MGKNNKIACIHITRNDVRIVEGRVSSGVILISHSAIVQKADRFFSGDRLANMSDLVSAIVNTMTMNSITAKELYIVYDNKSADGIRSVAALLLPSLSEGFSLHESMALYPKYFETYVNQVEVGEAAGKTGDVLNRISDQIKNANKIMGKLKSALSYPVMVLAFTFAAAAYLFTSVIPDMLNMLTDIGVAELPATTQLVMNIGDWMKQNGLVSVNSLSTSSNVVMPCKDLSLIHI